MITRQVSSKIQELYALFCTGFLSTALHSKGKYYPLETSSWEGGLGAECASRGSVDAPSGLRRGGNPVPGIGLYCAWGPRQRHFVTDNAPFQGCSPSGTTTPCCDGACSTSGHTFSTGDYGGGNVTPYTPDLSFPFLPLFSCCARARQMRTDQR